MRRSSFSILGALATCLLAGGCASQSNDNNGSEAGTSGRRATQRNLDLAIDGAGYFIVQPSADGFLFTRNGEFAVSTSGELVNRDGYPLYPRVTVSEGASAITIAPDGVVRKNVASGVSELAGQIVLSRFARPDLLERDGIYFMPTDGSGEPITGRPGTKELGLLRVGQLDN